MFRLTLQEELGGEVERKDESPDVTQEKISLTLREAKQWSDGSAGGVTHGPNVSEVRKTVAN